MDISQDMINRINELAALKKAGKITAKELEEQANLRQEYLKQFRQGFKQKLETIEIVDKVIVTAKQMNKEEREKLKEHPAIVNIELQNNKYEITYKTKEITKQEIIGLLEEKEISKE